MISRRDALKLSLAGLTGPYFLPPSAAASQTDEPAGTPEAIEDIAATGPSLDDPIAVVWSVDLPVARRTTLTTLDSVIALDVDGNLYSFDIHTGEQRWHTPVGESLYSPIISGNQLFVDGMESIYAIDLTSGEVAWRFDNDGTVYSPNMVEDAVVFGSTNGIYHAVNPASGEELWRFSDSSALYTMRRHGNHHLAYSSAGMVYGIRPDRGTMAWKYSRVGEAISSAAVVHGVLYVADEIGTLHAINPTTGEGLWKFSGDGAATIPVPAEDLLLVRAGDFNLHALDAATGTELWSYQDEAQISPIVIFGTLAYFGNAFGALKAVDTQTGDTVWSFEADSGIYAPTSSGNMLFAGSENGTLHAVHAISGTSIWQHNLNSYVWSPIVEGNKLVAEAGEYSIYAIGNVQPAQLLEDVIVRGAPSPVGIERGTASKGEIILQIGATDTVAGESWVQIELAEMEGWVPASAIDASSLDADVLYQPGSDQTSVAIVYTEATIKLMLPTEADLPGDFENQGDTPQDFQMVVDALGGTEEVSTALTDAGWQASVLRSFEPSDPDSAGTAQILVTATALRDQSAALEVLPQYATYLEDFGWIPISTETRGNASAALEWNSPLSGENSTSMYVVLGQLLYQVTAMGPEGNDSISDVLFVVERIERLNS